MANLEPLAKLKKGMNLNNQRAKIQTCCDLKDLALVGIIGERTRSALQHKRAKGEKTGGDVPYGYNLDPDTGLLVENPAEQKAIRLIRKLQFKGHSLRAICADLKSEGYRTKTGKASWNPKTVSMIIKRAA